MTNLINYILESGIALGVFTLFYLIALKQEKAFVFNRFYLLGSVLLSLVLPFIHFSIASVPSELVMSTILMKPLELGSTTQSISTTSIGLWGYGLVATVLIIRILLKAIPLISARKHSVEAGGHRLSIVENSTSAYTFWDTVYLGELLGEDERELILAHEKVHANELHSLDIVFLEIVGALLWINPIILIIKKLARTNHEYLADAKVVNETCKESYVKTLATSVLKQHGFELAHAFHTSSTLKRIKMINQQNKQIMKIKQIFPVAIALALVVVFGCEDAPERLSDMSNQEKAIVIEDVQTSNTENLEDIYDIVEVQPGPSVGMTKFYEWVASNMQYPTQAKEAGVEGKVFVQFIVDETGEITEVKSIKGIGSGCDAEAVRVMKGAAKWTPGLVDNKPVKVRMIMPISFKLS